MREQRVCAVRRWLFCALAVQRWGDVRERLSSALIGVKGASLHATQELEVNPMARLKLLIVRGVIVRFQS